MQFFVRKLHGQACGVPRASRAVLPVFSLSRVSTRLQRAWDGTPEPLVAIPEP